MGIKEENSTLSFDQALLEVEQETKEFKTWFKDSKVIDEYQKPLILYHGSNINFDEFSTDTIGNATNNKTFKIGEGIFFTNLKEDAEGYAYERTLEYGGTETLYEVNLSLQNPLIINTAEIYLQDYDFSGYGDAIRLYDDYKDLFLDAVKTKNHDGIIIKEQNGEELYIALAPEQIKIQNKYSREKTIPIIDTPEFKSWFDGSKTVDEKNAPMVMYHGTNADFSTFKDGLNYFTPRVDYSYIKNSKKVISTYLSIKKPYFTDIQQEVEQARSNPSWINELKTKGYDSIIYANKYNLRKGPLGWADDYPQIVTFSLQQIKFANQKRNTFELVTKEIKLETEKTIPVTEFSEFKSWFNDSKIIDETGKPLILYHGSPIHFDTFDTNKINREDPDDYVNGFWFTSKKEEAQNWAKFPYGRPNTEGNGNVGAYYISMKNPATPTDVRNAHKEALKRANGGVEVPRGSYQDLTRQILIEQGFDGYARSPYQKINIEEFERTGETRYKYHVLKASEEYPGSVDLYRTDGDYITGYLDMNDAINQLEQATYVAFTPNQIKSATHNRGTFSQTNPNILYSGFDPTLGKYNHLTIADLLKPLKLNDAIPHLIALGKQVYQEGYTTVKPWLTRIHSYLGSTWDNFKSSLKSIYTTIQTELSVHLSNQRGSFAGIKAQTANHTSLDRAKELDSTGVSPEIIRQETGFFKSMDSRWRFEIDDSKAIITLPDTTKLKEKLEDLKIKLQPFDRKDELWRTEAIRLKSKIYDTEKAIEQKEKNIYLSDLLKHPKLYKAYPHLKEINISFADIHSRGDAYYNEISNYIILDNSLKANPNLKKLLLHEIQHAIQAKENLARGGSPSNFKKDPAPIIKQINEIKYYMNTYIYSNPEYQKLENQIDTHLMNYNDEAAQTLIEKQNKLLDDLGATFRRNELHRLDLELKASSGYDAYHKLAGEIEAYDVANRSEYTREQRTQTPPNLPVNATISFSTNEAASTNQNTFIDSSHKKSLSPIKEYQYHTTTYNSITVDTDIEIATKMFIQGYKSLDIQKSIRECSVNDKSYAKDIVLQAAKNPEVKKILNDKQR